VSSLRAIRADRTSLLGLHTRELVWFDSKFSLTIPFAEQIHPDSLPNLASLRFVSSSLLVPCDSRTRTSMLRSHIPPTIHLSSESAFS